MHKIFQYPRFSETLKGCPPIFSALWDKKFLTETCDTPYYAYKFSIPQSFWNIEGMPTKFFGTVRQKVFDEKLCYPLLCITFFDTLNFSETLKGCPRIFPALWDKKFSTETCDTPYYAKKFSDTPNFLKHWRNAHVIFQPVRQNFFDGNLWYPLLCIKVFDTPKFLKHWRNVHVNFQPVRQKFFDGNLWYLLLCIKFFDTPDFLKHWRNAHEIFRHCETKCFRRKIVITSIVHKNFWNPKFSETLKVCPRNFSALWDKKFSSENCNMHKSFRYPKVSETLKGCPPNFLALWDKMFSTKNCDTLYSA